MLIKVSIDLFLETTATGYHNSINERRHQRSINSHKIEQIQTSYAREFTCHGLSRVIFGNPVERALWFCFVVGMITLAVYLGIVYFSKYAKRDVRVEKRFRDMRELDIPAITLCDNLHERMTCYNNTYLLDPDSIGKRESVGSCEEPFSFFVTIDDYNYIEIEAHNPTMPGCFVINNIQGSRKQRLKSEYPIKVRFVFPPIGRSHLSVFIGNVTDDVIYHTQLSSKLSKTRSNVIQINQKTRIKRLSMPFQSNCTYGMGIENFFSEKYVQRSCIQSCFMREMFDECGTVIDRWYRFLTLEMKVEINKTHNETACLSHHLNQFFKYIVPDYCVCPLACDEVVLDGEVINKVNSDLSRMETEVSVHFLSMEEVSEEEIPDYIFTDYLAEMGGLVGVLVGMSVMSVLEVLVYFVLHMIRLFYR